MSEARTPAPAAELESVLDDEVEEDEGQGHEDVDAPDADGQGEDGERHADDADERQEQHPEGAHEAPDGQGDVRRHRGRAGEQNRFDRERERRIAAERRLDELERVVNQRFGQDAERTRQQEDQEFLAQLQLLPPEQQSLAIMQRVERRASAQTQQVARQLWDENDRRDFERSLRDDPRLGRYADRVEALRRQAPGVSRDILLTQAIGEAVRANLGRATTRARTRATAQAAQYGGRPPASGSGAQPPTRTRIGRTPAERLEGVPI
jgi:hypothetical protein